MLLGENQQYASPMRALEHHGVKGMHWGVRKAPDAAPLHPGQHGVKMNADGSVEIQPGANLQRLVRSSGKSLPMKDLTYASINEYDNAKYIKAIGGKGFFGGGRDRILTIQATQPIKAPSVTEATRVVSGMMLKDAAFRAKNTDPLGTQITKRELEQIRKDPTGKTAQTWYHNTNVKLTFDKDFDEDAPAVQAQVRKEFAKQGFNALRDENDVQGKIAKAPLIIFSPEKSLKVVKTTEITDKLRKANKAKLKQYKQNGKKWLDNELYNGQY